MVATDLSARVWLGTDVRGKATVHGGRRLLQQPRGIRLAEDGSLLVADFGKPAPWPCDQRLQRSLSPGGVGNLLRQGRSGRALHLPGWHQSLPLRAGGQATGCAVAGAALLVVSRRRRARRGVRGWRQGLGLKSSLTESFLKFVNSTGSPAHTTAEVKRRLLSHGFKELHEGRAWALEAAGRYFVTQQGTSICAFVVGGAFDPREGGVVMAAAHTDSPCLKLRPTSKLPSKAGTSQLGVDTYGGGLWHTWFDRPLGFAGKVIVSTGEGDDCGIEERLVRVAEPVCIIPNLAIHLQTLEERKAFAFNKETQLRPVLCRPCGTSFTSEAQAEASKKEGDALRHPEELLAQVAEAAGVDAARILDVDICLMDASPSCLMGSYVSSPRIDNVLSTWAAVDALIEFAVRSNEIDSSPDLFVAASFDHEEVGSVSATGADSAVLGAWLQRALAALDSPPWAEVAPRSFLLSCDCAHGLHPNYAEKHQEQHQPLLGEGVVIKTNANQRYATTPTLARMVRELGRRDGVPIQDFVVRNDCPCGSTIGPLLSAQLGVRTVDVGAPQWAMHSCRETAHASDVESLQRLCLALFTHFRDTDKRTTCL